MIFPMHSISIPRFLLTTPIYIFLFTILQSQVNQEISKINQWMINNKLTINYKKSCYMMVSKRTLDTSNFIVFINHNKIEKNYTKYFDVYIDDKLTWKNQIDHLSSKLSKVCGLVFKLRHYVPPQSYKDF